MTDTIVIQDVTFECPISTYAEGHVLSANEASALTQLKRENVRNNFRKDVIDEQAKAKEENREINLPALQEKFSALCVAYEFGNRRSVTRMPVDPVEREAHGIAKAMIVAALAAKNMKMDKEQLQDTITKLLASSKRETIYKEARRRVKVAAEAVGDSLADLFGSGEGE